MTLSSAAHALIRAGYSVTESQLRRVVQAGKVKVTRGPSGLYEVSEADMEALRNHFANRLAA